LLHILNGDASAAVLKQSNLEGHLLPWREALIDGPAPRVATDDDWISIRAEHLAGAYAQEIPNCERSLRELFRGLESFSQYDEVVLWFDPDLFCQVNLIFVLHWFSRRDRGDTKLSLISIDSFPGVDQYYGFGHLTPEQLVSLYPQRIDLTESHLWLGRQAWEAFSSPNPMKVEIATMSDSSELPFLHQALLLHLGRFPSVRNGLGRIENLILDIVKGGSRGFPSLFKEFSTANSLYGLGDSQFWNALSRLAKAENPLVDVNGFYEVEDTLSSEKFALAEFELTGDGEKVLANECDFIELNGIDLWLGGVHLTLARLWRWDDEQGKLVGPEHD
jgi:hypothetical protein